MSARPSNRQPGIRRRHRPGPAARAVRRLARRGAHRRSAAVIALVAPRPTTTAPRLIDYYDLGQATYAMMLAAADLGIGYPPTARCAPSPSRTAARWAR